MSSPLFRVKSGGLLTTVQDLGRSGFLSEGVGSAGAADPFSLQVANLLVGNSRGDAALEITLSGPEMIVLRDTEAAICGADLSAVLDDGPIALWKSFGVPAGANLRFGRRTSGARTYLAVSGGFDVPVVLGSRSTSLRGALGGYLGRAIQVGDELSANESPTPAPTGARALAPAEIPVYADPVEIRVMRGPHADRFTKQDTALLFSSQYTVTAQSDRMGCRLDGPAIGQDRVPVTLVSEPAPIGGIQIPPDGKPIVLMVDRQTIGGYPLAAVVISADIPLLAQVAPGGRVAFRLVTLQEAQHFAAALEKLLITIQFGVMGRQGLQEWRVIVR